MPVAIDFASSFSLRDDDDVFIIGSKSSAKRSRIDILAYLNQKVPKDSGSQSSDTLAQSMMVGRNNEGATVDLRALKLGEGNT